MKELIGSVVGISLIAAVSSSGAATVFFDDFNRPNSTTVGNGWSVIESGSSDVGIYNNALQLRDERFNGTATVTNPDAAAARLALSTVGFGDIQLSFDWRPLNTDSESTDRLWASYNLGKL